MPLDPLSPIAPARIRGLLLPVGKIRRSRFLALAERLQAHNVVRLGDVSPEGRLSGNFFFPSSFPGGMVLYDLDISLPSSSESQHESFPFEPWREPYLIIAIADGSELPSTNGSDENSTLPHPNPEGITTLQDELESMKQDYPRSLLQHVLIFDHEEVSKLKAGPDRVTWIPNPQASRSTTMNTVMCDLTAALLLEMSAFVDHIQELLVIESPKNVHLSVQQRMTMPAQLPSAPSPSPSITSSTRSRELASTFDDITRSMQTEARAAEKEASHKSPSWTGFGRDRMSVSSSPIPERMRSRVKGRQLVVIGSLYMQAGRWPDAIKEFVEAITVARSNSDYTWHGKALECILLCLLMLGWAGMDFQIPSNFYPFTDKSASKSILTSQSTPSSSALDLASSTDRETSLQHLVNILPDISNYILNLYHRSSAIADEPLPQLIYSETVLRLSRLLTAVSLRHGKLDDLALKNIVLNEPLAPAEKVGSIWSFHRNDIASFLMRALPPPSGIDTPITDSISILAGISSVLGTLRLERKRAFILRELFAVLVPGLVQARKAGAAAMGIHPAAGLPVLNSTPFDLNALDLGNGNVEGNIRSLLGFLVTVFGVSGFDISTNSKEEDAENHTESDSVEAIVTKTLRHVHLKSFGAYALKVEILKACINFCEALPDFQGVLEFTIELLQTIRGTLMLDWDGFSVVPNLPRDEQLRLLANIQRTVGAAGKHGSWHLEAEYWDDFLIRGIELANASNSKKLARRSKVEFGVPMETAAAREAENGPFIYNPFAKTSETHLPDNVLIAEETASFKVTLQNPFEFDIEIEDLRLDATGSQVQGSTGPFVLQAFAIQEKSVVVTVASKGTLRISGCIAKIRYCRERRFPIFHKTWELDIVPKAKKAGLDARELILPEKRPTSVSKAPIPTTASKNATRIGPEADTLEMLIIQPQPTLTVKSTSFSQSAIMMLEGERRSFTISLENTSSCPVDFLFFTFEDSTARELQSILNNKDLPAADLYEIDLQLSSRPVLRWRRETDESENVNIAPGATMTFTLDVLGKSGLSDAVVRIDYGSTGVAVKDMPDTFYSRRISIPITITVNAAVEISRCDILPFNGDFRWQLPKDADEAASGIDGPIMSTDFSRILAQPSRLQRANLCLLLLDVRNSWPSPLSICLNISDQSEERTTDISLVAEVRPGHSTRFVAAIPQIYIENPHKCIPRFAGIDNRQFVVNTRPLSYDAEVFGRETFWYREELLKMLSCTWSQSEGDRKGEVDLRNMRLSARAIDALRVEDIQMAFSLHQFRPQDTEASTFPKTSDDKGSVIQIGPSKFSAPIDTFLTLHVHLVNNHSSQTIHPLLRLQPSVRNQHHTQALDLTRRLAWTGMLQRPLPPLAPQSTTTVALGITALSRGEYEIAASLEEIRILPATGDEKIENAQENEMTIMSDSLIANAGGALRPRRIWHSRVPCRLSAQANDTQDNDNDDEDKGDDNDIAQS